MQDIPQHNAPNDDMTLAQFSRAAAAIGAMKPLDRATFDRNIEARRRGLSLFELDVVELFASLAQPRELAAGVVFDRSWRYEFDAPVVEIYRVARSFIASPAGMVPQGEIVLRVRAWMSSRVDLVEHALSIGLDLQRGEHWPPTFGTLARYEHGELVGEPVVRLDPFTLEVMRNGTT